MSNDTGLNPYAVGNPYTDAGTGAYPNPVTPQTYGAEHDPEPTGAVEGPPPEVTTESPPEHLSEPTGAAPNPPAEVRSTQWPATDETAPDTKAVQDADNKAVKKPTIKNKGAK